MEVTSRVAVETTLVGRSVELAEITRRIDATVSGHGQLVLVEGEPGAGKSTILDAACETARQRGVQVFTGAGEELEQGLRFAAASGWLARTGITLDVRSDDLAVTETILSAVEQWCTTGPVLLRMDDLQWADEGTLTTLHRLARTASQQRILLIAAFRPTANDAKLNALLASWRSQGATNLSLPMLDDAAVAQIVHTQFSADPGPRLRGLIGEAGGNPLYVTELVAALRHEGTVEVRDGVAEVAPGAERPKSLLATILRRLSFLPSDVRAMLRTAAVLGAEVLVGELAMVQHRSVASIMPLISVAQDAGVLVGGEDRLMFRHELIRTALAEDLPSTVRSALHLEVSHALATAGAEPERIAEHVYAATEMDTVTLSWLLASADSLTARSPQMAVTLLRRALESARLDSDVAAPLRRQLIRGLLIVDPTDAEHLARAALRAAVDPDADGELRWFLVQSLGQQGRLIDQITEAERALESPFLSRAEIARFFGTLAEARFYIEDYDGCAVAARQALDAGREAGDRYGEARGYAALAGVMFYRRATLQSLELVDQAIATLSDVSVRADETLTLHLSRGFLLADLDRFGEADASFSLGVHELETVGWTRFLDGHHFGKALLRYLQGRWDDALAEVDSGLSAQDRPGGISGDFTDVLSNCAELIRIHRGEMRDDSVAVTPALPGIMERNYGILSVWATALLLESRGQTEEAFESFFEGFSRCGRVVANSWAFYAMPDLIRLAMTLGRTREIATLDTEVEEILNQVNNESRNAIGSLSRGMLDGDVQAVIRAGRRLRRTGRPLCYAYAMEHAAVLNATAELRPEARKNAGEALRVYHELGCVWAAARTESRLRDLGIRLGTRGPRGRPRTGWDALTETENRVLALVAEGKSNPEIATIMFLSRRTVASHVSSILSKVQLTSRVELAVAAHERPARV
jgi:DNA-binding CsgD family transcriptional regulator